MTLAAADVKQTTAIAATTVYTPANGMTALSDATE